jgi:(p)ppGpp synthase/HD superfamily hydrolase
MDGLQGSKVDIQVIERALNLIKRYHGGVKRKSGEPFFTHPIQAALILMEYTKDQDAIVAALLHDTVEDTSLSMAHIRLMFGETVAYLVNKATNLEDKLKRISLQEHETNYRLMNYEDERAAFIKLSDRLHNMRTIQGHSSIDKQKHIANETLLFFVPLAKQLGMAAMAEELEELCFGVLGR